MSDPFDTRPFEPLSPAEREANYESFVQARNRATPEEATASNTRSAILTLMGAWSKGHMARPEVLALLEQHEANLRRAWENAELGLARKRADDAMRGACRALMDGKLL